MEIFTRTEIENKRIMEEEAELDDFERRQEELREKELLERLEAEKKSAVRKPSAIIGQKKNSQLKLLAGAVKRKTDKEEENSKKVKSDATKNLESGQKGSAPPAPSLLGLADYGSDSESE